MTVPLANVSSRVLHTLLFAFIAASCLMFRQAFAAPPAGTVIGNQASATYSDASSVTRTVTSNAVTTIVQQVASLTLTANGTKTGAIGGQVSYPHTLTNTGNGTDTFTLAATGNTGTVTLTNVAFYADANGDGVADNSVAITSTGELAAGGVFKYVVVGTVPSSAVAGNTNTLTVAATSTFSGSATASNTDSTTVSAQAVLSVSQAIDVSSGASPAGPRTITITYNNVGNNTATNLVLTDVVPSGMTYVAGSGRWSVTGAGTALTDTTGDNQSGILYDYNSGTKTVTGTIASVPAGSSGQLTFQVNVNSGLAPGANATTALTAQYAYNDGASAIAATNTNTVQYTVNASAAVAITPSTVASVSQGGVVVFTNTVTNNGNGTDTFNISTGTSTFPAGTTFQLYQADGVTPLRDTNGDIPDTGPLAAAASYNVVVKAILPAGATGGPYTVQVTAASKVNTSATASATDTLTSITANTVDVTNNTSGPGSPGVGAGPEVTAAVTNAVQPGQTTRFTLVIANSSATADTFSLQASTDSTFGTQTIPSGWTVVFRDSNGAILTNTGTINSGSTATVYADVTPPVGTVGTQDLFFRAISPSSGASDRLHDAVTVGTVRSLVITPNQSGQVVAGGAVVYTHSILNTGNVAEGDGSTSTVTLAVASTAGFSSVVYWDKNNNGVLDASDPVITDLSQLTGGSNGASTAAGLSVNEQATLFVKVTAPPGATPGTNDTTTLTATVSGVVNGQAAPAAAVGSDVSTVIVSSLTLVLKHALDAACDGTADTAYSTATITIGAAPGACIRYEITATNAGAATLTSVVVNNATPANTVYSSTVAASTTVGSITAPADGAAGTVSATIGSLTPNQTAVVNYGVKIAP